ncbi:hypothetical protein RBB50_011378 [Rhinocladiella similis]
MSSSNTSHKAQHKEWTREGFLISTDQSLIDITALQRAFDSEDVYWAKSLPEANMRTMIESSLCFGLYSLTTSPPPVSRLSNDNTDATGPIDSIAGGGATGSISECSSSSPSTSQLLSPLVGFARGITDGVTFFYLTDVYISSEWRSQGLGKWLIQCVQEVIENMPHLRRSLLFVGHGRVEAEALYTKLMKMERIGNETVPLLWKGPGCTF